MRFACTLVFLQLLCAFQLALAVPPQGKVEWYGFSEWITGSPQSYGESRVDWKFVEEYDERGNQRWIERKLDWSAKGEAWADDLIYVDVGDMARRWHAPYSISCSGGGQLDYGSTIDERIAANQLQQEQRPQCTEHSPQNAFGKPYPSIWVGPPNVGPVNWEELRDNCAWSQESYSAYGDGVWSLQRESIFASPESSGMLKVDADDYAAFVPELANSIVLTAHSPTPALFRFTLDASETSAFAGFATNQDMSDSLLEWPLAKPHLIGSYNNSSPDLIFEPQDYADRDIWLEPSFGQIETKSESTSVSVIVTAMDYAAVGRIRGYVKGKCGGWQPLTVKAGSYSGQYLDLPRDEDHNLMSDALEDYRNLKPDADEDQEPSGDGTPGDGLTAFEEYRGFLVESRQGCNSPYLNHVRTKPTSKDLFVEAESEKARLGVALFALASNLTTHLICEKHYFYASESTPNWRIRHHALNFTLQEANQRNWQGQTISQAEPQHMIKIGHRTPQDTSGFLGKTFPNSSDPEWPYFGPPKFTQYVWVKWDEPDETVAFTTAHELGHAVGIPHHSDHLVDRALQNGRQNVTSQLSFYQRPQAPTPEDDTATSAWEELPDALLVDPGPDCVKDDLRARYRGGEFVGCLAGRIARQGGQNSGDADCPMRYIWGDFHEVPDHTVFYKWNGLVTRTPNAADGTETRVHAWGGPVRRYLEELEGLGLGKFCSESKGTKLNAFSGERNHAGDLGRDKPCSGHIVVNDLVVSGLP